MLLFGCPLNSRGYTPWWHHALLGGRAREEILAIEEVQRRLRREGGVLVTHNQEYTQVSKCP
jgi:hypothetical protein